MKAECYGLSALDIKIEKTEIWITCEQAIEGDGTAVRGFLGNIYKNRSEFQEHMGELKIC